MLQSFVLDDEHGNVGGSYEDEYQQRKVER